MRCVENRRTHDAGVVRDTSLQDLRLKVTTSFLTVLKVGRPGIFGFKLVVSDMSPRWPDVAQKAFNDSRYKHGWKCVALKTEGPTMRGSFVTRRCKILD
jgi:hypothetical protein